MFIEDTLCGSESNVKYIACDLHNIALKLFVSQPWNEASHYGSFLVPYADVNIESNGTNKRAKAFVYVEVRNGNVTYKISAKLPEDKKYLNTFFNNINSKFVVSCSYIEKNTICLNPNLMI